MSDNPKRLKQTHLFDAPPTTQDDAVKAKMHAQETQVTGYVYGYREAVSSIVVYVGQTISLKRRDRQHRRDQQTPFDISYDADDKYIMFTISEMTVCFSNDIEEAIQRDVLAIWLDRVETEKIEEYGTFTSTSGLNFTRGGQHGATCHAAMKRRYLNFRDRYMPMFREYAQKFGSCSDIPQKHPLGSLTGHIRSGEMKVPNDFLHELVETLKFSFDNRKVASALSNFQVFLAAAYWWKQNRGEDLSNMPRSATIPADIPEIGGQQVGNNLHKYRNGIKDGLYAGIYNHKGCATRLKELNFSVTTTLSEEDIRRRGAVSRTNGLFEKMYPLLEYVYDERGHVNMKQGEPNPDLPLHLKSLLSTTNWKTISGYIYALRNQSVIERNFSPENKRKLSSLNFFKTGAKMRDYQIIQGLLYYFENEPYSFPQQSYIIPSREDIPKLLHGLPLGILVHSRRSKQALALPPRAEQLMQIYEGRGRPKQGSDGIRIRGRPEEASQWTEYKSQADASRETGISATRINTTLKGGYFVRQPKTGMYFAFEYVDADLNPMTRKSRAPPHGEHLKKRVRVGETIFDSLAAAADAYSMSKSNLSNKIREKKPLGDGFLAEYL